jgi:hypothetical protein
MDLDKIETRAPSDAARCARARPMPLDPPVMKIWRFFIGIWMGRGLVIRNRRKRRMRGRRTREMQKRFESAIDEARARSSREKRKGLVTN